LIREASLKARDSWGATLVIASHDLQWLYSISDKQLSIFKGNIFPTGMENIITGPFIKTNKKIFVKKMGDGQGIALKAPDPNTCTAAIIRKKNISIALEKQPANELLNQLSGYIVSMLLEKKTGHIMVAIALHDLSLVLRLTPDQISSLDLFPGKEVILKFLSNDVEWI